MYRKMSTCMWACDDAARHHMHGAKGTALMLSCWLCGKMQACLDGHHVEVGGEGFGAVFYTQILSQQFKGASCSPKLHLCLVSKHVD